MFQKQKIVVLNIQRCFDTENGLSKISNKLNQSCFNVKVSMLNPKHLQNVNNFKNANIVLKICWYFDVGTTLSKQRNVNYNPLHDNNMYIQFGIRIKNEWAYKKKITIDILYCVHMHWFNKFAELILIQITFWIEEN